MPKYKVTLEIQTTEERVVEVEATNEDELYELSDWALLENREVRSSFGGEEVTIIDVEETE